MVKKSSILLVNFIPSRLKRIDAMKTQIQSATGQIIYVILGDLGFSGLNTYLSRGPSKFSIDVTS